MKFCSVVPEICCEQVHASRKERRIIIIKIIIRNRAKTISPQTLFGRLNKELNKVRYNLTHIRIEQTNLKCPSSLRCTQSLSKYLGFCHEL
jgi:hypothetical protein